MFSGEVSQLELKPVTRGDLDRLYLSELRPETAARWRFRGATPSIEAFTRSFYDGLFAAYLVVDTRRGEIAGSVSAYNMDVRNGHCYLAAVALAPNPRGRVLRGLDNLVGLLFRNHPLRQVYVEVLEYNLPQFKSLVSQGFVKVAHFDEHEFWEGEYWARLVYSLSRSQYEARQRDNAARSQGPPFDGSFDAVIRRLVDVVPALAPLGQICSSLTNLDSLDWMVLLTELELIFGCEVPDGLVEELRTYADLEAYISSRTADRR